MNPPDLRRRLVLPAGRVDLDSHDPRATPGFKPGKTVAVEKRSKAAGREALEQLRGPLTELQQRLWAHGSTGGRHRLLVILQGMDTAGKGGVARHSGGLFEPRGLRVVNFRAPNRTERRHHFLWRIEKELPEPGEIVFFDRSHYEDVLVPRVSGELSATQVQERFAAIQEFEARLVEQGTTLVKCFLRISAEVQMERLLARLDDPTKVWKYDPHDVEDRDRWGDYRAGYQQALARCRTASTPWYLVPSDHKWYRNWAVAQLLREHLEALDLPWPAAGFDVDRERERLAQH